MVLVAPALGTPASGTATNITGLPIVAGTTGTLTYSRGGTGQTTYAKGDIIIASAADTLAKLAATDDGKVLTLASGAPTWASPTVGDITAVTAGSGLTGGGSDGDVTLTVGGTTNRISVTSTAVDIASGYVGQTSITTVGALAAGSIASGFTSISTSYTDAKVTSVVAGTLIDVSGTTGDVTVNTDLSELSTSTSDGDGDYFAVVDAANAQKKLTKANIDISGFNDAVATSITGTGALNAGSITSGFGAIDVGSSNIDGGTITADTALVGTLSTAAQTNITSLGTLTSLGVGAITSTGDLAVTGTSAGSDVATFTGQAINTTANLSIWERSGGAVASEMKYVDSSTDMELGTSTAHAFSLKTGDTRAMTIDTSQNWKGPAVAGDWKILHGANNGRLIINGSTSGAGAGINLTGTGYASASQINMEATKYVFGNTTGTTFGNWTSTGLAIGTTSAASELLHLYGTATINQEIESLNTDAYLIINSGSDGVGGSDREEGAIKFYQANADFWTLGKRNIGYFSLYDHTAGEYVLQFGDNGAAHITPANSVTNITGDVGISGGLWLGSGGDVTVAANELDDYEEGAWTPILSGATSGDKTAATGNLGRYTKVGNLCTVSGTVGWSGGDAIVGQPVISGLPFDTKSQSHGRDAGSFGSTTGLTFPASGSYSLGYQITTDAARDNMYVIAYGENSYGVPVVASAGFIYGFTMTYVTD
jgi:hypothetical protein